jgi:hypothetical protein
MKCVFLNERQPRSSVNCTKGFTPPPVHQSLTSITLFFPLPLYTPFQVPYSLILLFFVYFCYYFKDWRQNVPSSWRFRVRGLSFLEEQSLISGMKNILGALWLSRLKVLPIPFSIFIPVANVLAS